MNAWITKLSGILILTVAIGAMGCSNAAQVDEPFAGAINIIDPVTADASAPTVVESVDDGSSVEVAELDEPAEPGLDDTTVPELEVPAPDEVVPGDDPAPTPAEPTEPDTPALGEPLTIPEPDLGLGGEDPTLIIPDMSPQYTYSFLSTRGGAINLHLTKTRAGSAIQQISYYARSPLGFHHPVISNDGQSIAYIRGWSVMYGSIDDFNTHRAVRDAAGEPVAGLSVDWAPHGDTNRLAFVKLTVGDGLAYTPSTFNTQTQDLRDLQMLADSSLKVKDVIWHTDVDSDVKFFVSRETVSRGMTNDDIFGSMQTPLGQLFQQKVTLLDGIDRYDIKMSPDGTTLVYVAKIHGRKSQIVACTLSYDGLGQAVCNDFLNVWLTEEGNNESPCFTADSEYVLFASDRDGNKNIYMVKVDGSEAPVQLTDDETDEYAPACGRG